ncbi:MAG: acyltransferase [Fibrobacteres bacterium]|nr:acyltransferase [Fibrobacterota bacterium]
MNKNMSSDSKQRITNLDYLRGLAAFSIMVYHYTSWQTVSYNADSILGRLGYYGVSIFYVLSGLTLYHVYGKNMTPNREQLTAFYIKRIFRIFPLLWLATIATLVLNKSFPDLNILFMNLTGLFGLYSFDSNIAAGAWSIGNELVFYLFFPVFVYLGNKNNALLLSLGAILLFVYGYFAFAVIPNVSVIQSWHHYVNPLNQVLLFFCGFAIGKFSQRLHLNNLSLWILICVCIAGFVLWPVEGDRLLLITGSQRMFFSFVCIAACLAVYKMQINLPRLIMRPLSWLGEASYSVYLLHPLVWGAMLFLSNRLIGRNIEGALFTILAILITVLMSMFSYRYLELPLMKVGKNISARFSRT